MIIPKPFPNKPVIKERYVMEGKFNPISGHYWFEPGETFGYKVVGGGWLPTYHRTLKAAEKELKIREQILEERAARGEV